METLKYEKDLQDSVESYLTLPERTQIENNEYNLAKKLGIFLINEGYIKNVIEIEEECISEYDFETETIFINTEEVSLED